MASNRTYGIEIEMASKVDRETLAMELQVAFENACINHTCQMAGYSHNTDGMNTTRWEAQTDASISITPSHSFKIEIVSPVLKGQAGLDALKVVCQVATKYGKVNTSCGLHVHHGVRSYQEVAAVSKVYSSFQDVIYSGLPRSRSTSYYSKKWDTSMDLDHQIRFATCHRYTGLNLASYSLRKTIEFRCAAGSTEFEKISSWVLFTQGLVEAAVSGATCSDNDIDSLVEFVVGNTASSASVPTPTFRSNGRAVMFALIASGEYTKDRVLEIGQEALRCNLGQARGFFQKACAYMENKFGVELKVVNGICSWSSRNIDVQYAEAADWFQGRYNHFQNAA